MRKRNKQVIIGIFSLLIFFLFIFPGLRVQAHEDEENMPLVPSESKQEETKGESSLSNIGEVSNGQNNKRGENTCSHGCSLGKKEGVGSDVTTQSLSASASQVQHANILIAENREDRITSKNKITNKQDTNLDSTNKKNIEQKTILTLSTNKIDAPKARVFSSNIKDFYPSYTLPVKTTSKLLNSAALSIASGLALVILHYVTRFSSR